MMRSLFFILFISQSLSAQTTDSFSYKVGEKLHTFKTSYTGNFLKGLPKAVKKTYNTKQKRAKTDAQFVELLYDTAGKAEKYYYISEYDSSDELIYLYNAKGKLLYTVSRVPISENDKSLSEKQQKILDKYISIYPDSKENLQYIDIRKVQNIEKGTITYQVSVYGLTLYLLLDVNMNVTEEVTCLEFISYVGELPFFVPIFWK